MSIRDALRNKNLKNIVAESWSMSWPMTVIMFCTFIIGLFDVYVAGKFGKEIQAAYGLVYQIYFILTIIGTALTIGSVSVIARLFTSDKKEECAMTVDSSVVAVSAIGLMMAFVGVATAPLLVQWLRVPVVLKQPTEILLKIYNAGMLFNYMLINGNGILRACKKMRNSLVTMVFVCAANTALIFFFAFKTALGFRGIAVATVFSTFLGCLLNSVYMRRLVSFPLRFSWKAFKTIATIGWPAGVLQVVWQAGAMVQFVIIGMLPSHAVEIMAAFTNGLRIESVIFLPAFAFNMANAVVVGNVLGKKKHEDAFHSGIITALIGVSIVTVMTLFVMLKAKMVAGWLSNNDVVVSESIRYIYISLISEPFMAWGVILAGGLNGAGDTKGVMLGVAASVWLVKLPLSYVWGIVWGGGSVALWWSMNLAMLVQAILIGQRYFKKQWLFTSSQTV